MKICRMHSLSCGIFKMAAPKNANSDYMGSKHSEKNTGLLMGIAEGLPRSLYQIDVNVAN